MPSLYEGLPVAGIEAECTGIPCVFSENITKEVKLNNNVQFMSLSLSTEMWMDAIMKNRRRNDRTRAVNTVKNAGYDIHDVTLNMQDFYLQRNS